MRSNSLVRAVFVWVSKNPKSKLSQWPIRTKVNITISQWELKFETSKLLEVLENANGQGVIVFSVLSDLCREWLKPQQPQIAPSAFLINSIENCLKRNSVSQQCELRTEKRRSSLTFELNTYCCLCIARLLSFIIFQVI